MKRRFGSLLAVLTVALAVVLASRASAGAQGTITAVCTSGGTTQTCDSRWYPGPVSVVWRATPTPIGTSPCGLEILYEYATDGVTSLACTANWPEGEFAGFGFTLHVEATSPTAQAVPARPPDFDGWYSGPVAVTFTGHGYSGAATCIASGSSATATYAGPDTSSTTVSAICTDPAGKSAYPSVAVRYDATPPTITGEVPSRAPDFNGWYNHPVSFVLTGADATSGIESCTSPTYAGPDSAAAQVIGSCRDRAGNVATLAIPLRYQATPPSLAVDANAGDGVVFLDWRSSSVVKVVRSPGLRGAGASVVYDGDAGSFTDTSTRDGVHYRFALAAHDQAGNVTERVISVTPGPRLLSPGANAHLSAPPLLRWTPVRGASYYNLQLYRGGKKVLTQWPAHSSLQLKSAWQLDRHNYRLKPGLYRWYVWPGFGPRSLARYGRLIGAGAFVIMSTSRQ